jgi:phosphoribosylformimino-5-aminoimidazole carboxamide ribotide isomerase
LEESDEDLIPFIQGYQAKGINMSFVLIKNGMLEGPSFDLYAKMAEKEKKLPRVEFLPLMNCQN